MAAPRVVIVGGGFAGLSAARGLADAPVRITLIDRCNHHVFQPLLYQVATAALSPAQIAAPIRRILRNQKNVEVLLSGVTGVDLARRTVTLDSPAGEIVEYDHLVLATGVTHSYFGHDSWSADAPGLKTVDDALEIRRRFLIAFEAAEREPEAHKRRAMLTFIIVGAGPTGVELAGAIVEIARTVIPGDFRRIDTGAARVVLVEAMGRVLSGGFPEALSARALRDLQELGVEVRLNARVTAIDAGGVQIGPDRIDSTNVIWAAGVKASPLGRTLGVPVDGSGRLVVLPDLSVPGHPEVVIAGDLAHVRDARTGVQVPGMAPGAMQMGRYAARRIRAVSQGRPAPPPFQFVDKGTLATIGRARAVAMVKGFAFGGWFAWVFWALLHVVYLIGFRNRVAVMFDWIWNYMFFDRGARLITGGTRPTPAGSGKLG